MEKKTERRALGRGLSALLADVRPGIEANDAGSTRQADLLVSIASISPNPVQPRQNFDEAALQDLADSIRKKGIIQPIIVRPTAEQNRYEIVAGERRWRAAQIAQLHEVPVIIRSFSDSEVLEIAIIENIQREELNAIEEALAYRQLMDRFGHTQDKLAEAMSRSRSHIANMLRLLNLPKDVQRLLVSGELSAGHARALVSTPNPSELAIKVIGKGLTVRETEELVRKSSLPDNKVKSGRKQEKDADTRALEADLSASLGMSVRINHDISGTGQISIGYQSLDELDLLCAALSKAALE